MNLYIDKETPLTVDNVISWISRDEMKKEFARIKDLREWTLNVDSNGKERVKIPFAKKLTITAAMGVLGDGATYTEPDYIKLEPVEVKEAAEEARVEEQTQTKEQALFEAIRDMFIKQQMNTQDSRLLLAACGMSKVFELTYMSDDEVPVPKSKKIEADSAFVVYDNSIEQRPLYGVYFSKYCNDSKNVVDISAVDSVNTYNIVLDETKAKSKSKTGLTFTSTVPHNIGMIPLTQFDVNEEQQAVFSQVISLIKDRSLLHDLTLADTKKIVKNLLTLINTALAGDNKGDNIAARDDMNDLAVLTLLAKDPTLPVDAKLLSKNENYAMVDIFGKDIDRKIFDTTLIPDFTSEAYAGNITGVALEQRLIYFKYLISLIENLFKNFLKTRLKKYALALTQEVDIDGVVKGNSEYEYFDTDDIEIEIHRNWVKNIAEIAQIIMQLKQTELFSNEYLINLMPNADYETEQTRKQNEAVERATSGVDSDPLNKYNEEMLGVLRGMNNGNTNNSSAEVAV